MDVEWGVVMMRVEGMVRERGRERIDRRREEKRRGSQLGIHILQRRCIYLRSQQCVDMDEER